MQELEVLELAKLAETERQILGIVPKPGIDIVKMKADGEVVETRRSGEVQERARLYKLVTGKVPSWKEIEKWMR